MDEECGSKEMPSELFHYGSVSSDWDHQELWARGANKKHSSVEWLSPRVYREERKSLES